MEENDRSDEDDGVVAMSCEWNDDEGNGETSYIYRWNKKAIDEDEEDWDSKSGKYSSKYFIQFPSPSFPIIFGNLNRQNSIHFSQSFKMIVK